MDGLTVARVRRAHGLAGEVLVQAETDDGADVFCADRRFDVRGPTGEPIRYRQLTLVASRPHRGGYLLQFREVADRGGAETLLGAELLVDREELRPLAEGEYFLHELVGLEVVDEAHGSLGAIREVYDTAGQLLASVRVEGRERLLPLRRETVRRIDRESRTIEVAMPAGLLEL
ncbi:MAG: ribosome maturation factor RimM [Gemmatimonadales bacterium]|jgi:16S rRNA processing protein RimM